MTPARAPGARVAALLAVRARRERLAMRVAVAAAVVGTLSAVGLAGLSGWFLAGAGLAAAAGAALLFNYLLPSALIRQAAIFRTGARYVERLLAHRAALLALAGLRADLFRALAQRPPPEALRLSGGEAASRLVEDVDALENLLVRRPAGPAAVAGGAVAVALAGLAAPLAGLGVAALLLGLVPAAQAIRARLLDPAAAEAQAALAALKAAVVGAVEAAAEIRLMGLEARTADALATEAAALDAARLRFVRAEAAIAALVTLGAALAAALVLALAPGADVALAAGAALAAHAAIEAQAGLVRAATERARVTAGLARLDGLVEAGTPEAPAQQEAPPAAPLVFRRRGREVRLEAGGRLLLDGPSGAGKTRLLHALAGLAEPDVAASGIAMSLGGVPLAALPPRLLARAFALAPQAPTLIAGSIADNLALARPGLAEAEMWQALHVAGLDAVVRARAEGLAALLGDGGRGLSGGEAKRLALARALLAGRPWLLLDEPTEGLDPATEALVVDRLDRWLEETGTGLVLVSHRRPPRVLARGTVLRLSDVPDASARRGSVLPA